jgi:hypothetical protein
MTQDPNSATQVYCGCITPGQLTTSAPISPDGKPGTQQYCYLSNSNSQINISTNGFCNVGFSSCSIANINNG